MVEQRQFLLARRSRLPSEDQSMIYMSKGKGKKGKLTPTTPSHVTRHTKLHSNLNPKSETLNPY